MNLDIGTITIPLGRNAKYGTLDVTPNGFTETVNWYIYEYGLRQVLNDAIADKKDDDGVDLSLEAIRAKALKRLDNLVAGTLRTRTAGDAIPLDPFEAEWYKLCKTDITEHYRLQGKLKGLPKGTKDQVMFVVNRDLAVLGKAPIDWETMIGAYQQGKRGKSLAKTAEENLAARTKSAEGDDDFLSFVESREVLSKV